MDDLDEVYPADSRSDSGESGATGGSVGFRNLLRALASDDPGLAAVIPKDMRAVSFEVPPSRGFFGMIRSGDKVDLMDTFLGPSSLRRASDPAARTGGAFCALTCRGVRVLWVGGTSAHSRTTSQKPAGGEAVTAPNGEAGRPNGTEKPVRLVVAVPASEVDRVIAAADAGTIWLALVPSGEPDRLHGPESPLQDEPDLSSRVLDAVSEGDRETR